MTMLPDLPMKWCTVLLLRQVKGESLGHLFQGHTWSFSHQAGNGE
jgi:hypothetical protein